MSQLRVQPGTTVLMELSMTAYPVLLVSTIYIQSSFIVVLVDFISQLKKRNLSNVAAMVPVGEIKQLKVAVKN